MSKTYHNDEGRGLPRKRSTAALAAKMRHAGRMRHRNDRRINEKDEDLDTVDIMTMSDENLKD